MSMPRWSAIRMLSVPFCSKYSSLLLSACLVSIELLVPFWPRVASCKVPFWVRLTVFSVPFWLITAVWSLPNCPPSFSPFQLLAMTLLPVPWVVTVRLWLSPVW
ncbi:hypothetical protein D3C81_1485640 [compost metagenome]